MNVRPTAPTVSPQATKENQVETSTMIPREQFQADRLERDLKLSVIARGVEELLLEAWKIAGADIEPEYVERAIIRRTAERSVSEMMAGNIDRARVAARIAFDQAIWEAERQAATTDTIGSDHSAAHLIRQALHRMGKALQRQTVTPYLDTYQAALERRTR